MVIERESTMHLFPECFPMKIALNRLINRSFIPRQLFAMHAAAPDGAPPRRISDFKQYLKRPHGSAALKKSPEAGSYCKITYFNNFHGSGVNLAFMSVSPEQKERKKMLCRNH
jgi:hypothetical protein